MPVGSARTSQRQTSLHTAGPFLKWAGGKKALSAKIAAAIRDAGYARYFEPFVGGGAVLFALQPTTAVIADSSPLLVNAYLRVQKDVNGVVAALGDYTKAHSREFYYRVRTKPPVGDSERAAWLIYLNRTCFNGLWRVNSKGEFNVPIGSYSNPRILDRDKLVAASRALKGVKILCADFEEVLTRKNPRPKFGDAVYLDPPYDPLTNTSRFTAYTRENFVERDQRRLSNVAAALAERGVHVVVSNSDTPLIRSLYHESEFRVEVVKMARAISSVGTGRGKISELLIDSTR